MRKLAGDLVAIVTFIAFAACSSTDNGSIGWGSGANQTLDVAAGSAGSAVFELTATGNAAGSYMIATTPGGSAVFTALAVSPTTVSLTDGVAVPITVSLSVGSDAGTGTAFVTAMDIDDGTDSTTATLTVVVQ